MNLSDHWDNQPRNESAMSAELKAENDRLRFTLAKVEAWMLRLAQNADRQAELNADRFASLAEANRADAKNWRATAKDIRNCLEGK